MKAFPKPLWFLLFVLNTFTFASSVWDLYGWLFFGTKWTPHESISVFCVIFGAGAVYWLLGDHPFGKKAKRP